MKNFKNPQNYLMEFTNKRRNIFQEKSREVINDEF